jgi:hypothetical protein
MDLNTITCCCVCWNWAKYSLLKILPVVKKFNLYSSSSSLQAFKPFIHYQQNPTILLRLCIMIRNRCKLYAGYIAPDKPHNSPQLSFLSLPIEIRDEIYDLAVVSTSNIIVWKGEWKSEGFTKSPD